MSIITVSDAQEYMGVASGTDTTLITRLITYSQALIENYTDAKFDSADIEGEVLEYGVSEFDLDQQDLIDLRGYDIVAFTRYSPISDVTIYSGDDELTFDEDYKIDSKRGQIYFYTGVTDDAQNLTIDYTYGYTTYPDDLKFVCLDMVAQMYADHGVVKGEGDIESKKLGDFSVSYRSKIVDVKSYSNILDRYRVVNI